jgi:CHAT domain-containing protein
MEDAAGERCATTAADLLNGPPYRPRLVFLSACLTAAGGESPEAGSETVVHSLATALLRAGTPAVLGWDGSVSDGGADGYDPDRQSRNLLLNRSEAVSPAVSFWCP